MTEKQLNVFMAVAATGTFSQAAETLSISEPAVSRCIKSLEKEFGCEFFTRSKGRRSLSLTEKGTIFFDIARRWQFLIGDAMELSEDLRNDHLRLIGVSSLTRVLLPQVCHGLIRSHPRLHISIDSHHSRTATELIADSQYDLALVSYVIPNQRVQSIPVFQEEIKLICSRTPGSSGPVALTDLDPARQLFIAWDTDSYVWEYYKYNNKKVPDSFVLDSRTTDGLEYFAREMNMWSLVPVTLAEDFRKHSGLSVHDLIGDIPKRVTYALHHIHNSNPLIHESIELVRENASKIKGVELL